jgi:hypothetical protein
MMGRPGARVTGHGLNGGGPGRLREQGAVPFFFRADSHGGVCVCADKPEQQPSEAEIVAAYEVSQARKTRASCASCGHTWRPRNPSQRVNRCPGCGIRGRCSYRTLATQPDDVASAEREGS